MGSIILLGIIVLMAVVAILLSVDGEIHDNGRTDCRYYQ